MTLTKEQLEKLDVPMTPDQLRRYTHDAHTQRCEDAVKLADKKYLEVMDAMIREARQGRSQVDFGAREPRVPLRLALVALAARLEAEGFSVTRVAGPQGSVQAWTVRW